MLLVKMFDYNTLEKVYFFYFLLELFQEILPDIITIKEKKI
ncbi:hypothetical protein HMPREF3181_00209 [Parvimonas sp. KA00067]|nr:hypothetical protein HMPREF3181_00209 [Parvimonas sp. KA00067]